MIEMIIYFKKLFYLIFLLFASIAVMASDRNIEMGRYLSVSSKPLHEQENLLAQVFQVHFPQGVQTVGDAMHYLLKNSGYSLVNEAHQSEALKNTLKKPLPLIDRHFGPMTLKDALVTLVGPAFYLVNDPLNREVNFKVKQNQVNPRG